MTSITVFQNRNGNISLKSSFLMFNSYRNLDILETFMVSNLRGFLGLIANQLNWNPAKIIFF